MGKGKLIVLEGIDGSGKSAQYRHLCQRMENDRIMKISEPEFEIGDMIEYNIVGSYSMCFNSLFISYLPYVYSLGSDNLYRIVRIKWGVKEYIQGNRWLF